MPKEDWYIGQDLSFDYSSLGAELEDSARESLRLSEKLQSLDKTIQSYCYDTVKEIFEGEGEISFRVGTITFRLSHNDWDDDICIKKSLKELVLDEVTCPALENKSEVAGWLIKDLKEIITELEKINKP